MIVTLLKRKARELWVAIWTRKHWILIFLPSLVLHGLQLEHVDRSDLCLCIDIWGRDCAVEHLSRVEHSTLHGCPIVCATAESGSNLITGDDLLELVIEIGARDELLRMVLFP